MYSTCLYCTKDLGANEVIETLPIGRRIAFDARQGRLWVVCRACEKWNLVPFDTRLETIDACERLFSETRVRFSTDNIGIARLKEGLELVRIGPAQRPEFASWRYGDQFGRRRRMNALKYVAGGGAAIALVLSHRLLVPLLGAGMSFQYFNVANAVYRSRRAVVRIPEKDAVGGVMTRMQVKKARIVTDGSSKWSLVLPMYESARGGFAAGWFGRDAELDGDHAVDALGRILPRVNAGGASATRVRDAVDVLEERPGVLDLLKIPHPDIMPPYVPVQLNIGMVARLAANRPPPPVRPADAVSRWTSSYRLSELPVVGRLALEMLAHEDTERAALAGELKLLEREWKAADELAKIADSLVPSMDAP